MSIDWSKHLEQERKYKQKRREETIARCCEKHNVILKEKEKTTLLGYDESSIEWLISYIKNNKNELYEALASYHSDWSGAQGGL